MKEKIAKKRAEQEGYNHYEEYPEDSGVKRLCRQQANQILALITEEIEKVENKWLNKDIDSEGEYAVLCYNREKGFEECRQMILALLKE